MTVDNPYVQTTDLAFDDVSEVSEDTAAKQVAQLREALDIHDHRYYVQNAPLVSDPFYDRLFQRLQDLEETFPALQSPNSPTRRVGAPPLDSLERVDHVQPMLSLDAELDHVDVVDFDRFVREHLDDAPFTYACEPKFDGLSVEMIYEGGELVRAATRGNGQQGELITANVRTINTVPLRLRGRDWPDFLAARAEILMPRSGFQSLNKQRLERGQSPFANPRNAAAGAVRLLDSAQVAARPLDIFFYGVMDASRPVAATECEALEVLSGWGLKIDEHSCLCETFADVEAFYQRLGDLREGLDYEIDGMVIKVNEFDLRQRLGMRSRSPRWALAWKFVPKRQVTRLEDIGVQVGRTGKLTPVALLAPVEVGGVTVSRATLHNVEEVHAKGVRAGDTVRIQRAGDVIPEVVERVEDAADGARGEPFEMVSNCPSCAAGVVREGPNHFCPNGMSCPAQLKGRIEHFAARNALDIDGLGEETVEQLVERELVRSVPDLFELDVDTIISLDRFAERSAQKLYDHIQASKTVPLDRFIFGLGIPMVGQHTARLLAEAFGSLDAIRRADAAALEEVFGVGAEIAASVVDFFNEVRNQTALDRLFELDVVLEAVPGADGNDDLPLEGKTFVFTGGLDDFTRGEAKRRIQALGGRATSRVSGATDYVVAGDNPGSKLDQARQRGVEILDEAAFRALLGPSNLHFSRDPPRGKTDRPR